MITRSREIAAPAAVLWELLTDPADWPRWGPTVRAGELDEPMRIGATGRVSPAPGVWLPFTITAYDVGRRWAWRVAGVPATDHAVERLGASRCRVTFGVPAWAPAYVAVCELALRRLDRIATGTPPG